MMIKNFTIKLNHQNIIFQHKEIPSSQTTTTFQILKKQQLRTSLLLKLNKLKSSSKYVGDVRGKGLMIGVELVEDGDRTKPLSNDKMVKIMDRSREMGLLIGRGGNFGNVIRIKPPMCITQADADFCVNVLKDCIIEV